jgi:hypothetical protein
MEAIFNRDFKTKFNRNHRKENGGFMYEYAAIVRRPEYKDCAAVVTLRVYGTGARNYACLWVQSAKKDIYTQGSDYAGGGYHRPSAAAHGAIINAGFTLSEDIDGRGDRAIINAVKALAAAAGHPNALIHVAHA